MTETPTLNDETILTGMTAAADVVGAFLVDRPRPAPTATLAAFRDAFTALDEEAARVIRPHLEAIDPTVPWVDELRAELPSTGRAWVIDTADGAVQYLQGGSAWTVSITLVENGEAVATVLHSPTLAETYTATKGGGAFVDGHAVGPASKTELRAAVAATGQPPLPILEEADIARAGTSLAAVLRGVGAVRSLAPTSWLVADVAAGRLDAFWEFGADAGNLLGAVLVAREAGAVVTDAEGRPWRGTSPSIVVTSESLHAEFLRLLADV